MASAPPQLVELTESGRPQRRIDEERQSTLPWRSASIGAGPSRHNYLGDFITRL